MEGSRNSAWGAEAFALAVQARTASANKLDQFVRRLQRSTGRSREACWRFVIQQGLQGREEHRRWTDDDIEQAREDLTKYSVEEVARKLKRSPKALRAALNRNGLSVREIRCDCFSIESLAHVLHVRKSEIYSWIEKGWLRATVRLHGKRKYHIITPEAFSLLYQKHLRDLLAEKRIPNLALFEAFYQYGFAPKHTIGEQLLTVRRDKRERAAFAAATGDIPPAVEDASDEDEEEEFDDDQRFVISRE